MRRNFSIFLIGMCSVFQAIVPGILASSKSSEEAFKRQVTTDFKLGLEDPHIVGGEEVEAHSHPHQVGLLINEDIDKGFCGGSLLSESWVITAAHCTDFTFARHIGVVVGAHRIKEIESTSQVIPIDEVFLHPEWKKGKLENDISLIRLLFAARLNEYVQPIRLSSEKQKHLSFWNSQVSITGWGYVSDKSLSVAPVLRSVTSRVITNFYCSFRYLFRLIKDTNICASGWHRKGTCHGDSGGPLTIKESDGVRTLIGISSFGVGLGCEKSWPVVFTRVTSYLDWIHNTTSIPWRK